MNFGIKLRLALLGLGVIVVGSLIAAVILDSQKQAGKLRESLNNVDSETFRIADHFRESIRLLNNTTLRYGVKHDPGTWDDFLKASHLLDLWIDDQKPRLRTQEERDAFQKIDVAFDTYLQAAAEFHAKMLSLGQQDASLRDFDSLRAELQRLSDLGQALARAHYRSREILLIHASQSLTRLRMSELSLLGLLFLFAFVLAAMVYRDMIAPLRMKLVESQWLVERQEKLASLGMLAAGVAHEVRNPLTAIKAALFIQQKKFLPGSAELSDSKLVEREILRLERIVNDFLDFARPTEPNLTTLPAAAPLRDVQSLFKSQLAEADIQCVLEDTAGPMWIKADPAQIKQVLINLVQNAADSIGRHGAITLSARQDRLRLTNGETDVVVFDVADTGKGISPEVEKRLFDPFFTTKENGTGLGLSIAARIIEKHGGALQYKRRGNRGTVFGVVLPQAPA